MSEPAWVALGAAAVDYEGVWAAGTSYAPGDVVTYAGVTYIAVNPSTGQTPPTTALPTLANTPWQTYTPTFTAEGGGAAIGNGQIYGRYQRIGRLISLTIEFIPGSTTAFGTGRFLFSFPPGAAPIAYPNAEPAGAAVMVDASPGVFHSGVVHVYGTNFALLTTGSSPSSHASATAPFTWANGDRAAFSITYEAAS